MPKQKSLLTNHLRMYVHKFGKYIFITYSYVLVNKICVIKVSTDKKFNIKQYIARDKHIMGIN